MEDKKNVYFYIDESGKLDAPTKEDRFFIISCCITDIPERIRLCLERLREGIENDPYLFNERTKFKKEGFHACENHPDIRTKVYSLLYTQSVRIYSLVLDKKSEMYKDRIDKHGGKGLYYELLYALLKDRLSRNKESRNILTFEEYGGKQNAHKAHIEKTIGEIVINEGLSGLSYEVEVHDKSDLLLSVVDYVNYILFEILHKEKDKANRMYENFKLVEPKIALLHHIDKKRYYAEKKRINFNEIKGQGEGN